mgnify:FL=1
MAWITAIGLLFGLGQGMRWYTNTSQLDRIEQELHAQYASVLGEDMGSSPFGRLQFVHGQATAQQQFGLDPLVLIAEFSRHADFMVRIDKVALSGERGTLEGMYTPDQAAFKAFLQELDTDEEYEFSLESREETLSGIHFVLKVGRR